ncbi:1-deoxy-D-xylulose-5-phosphate synthase [Cycloclasticus pugetii]|uniref:1-deoxy-D-xylulose-5-phosphate synthase n=1 Tax=Cycloclasticus pugetii TaxID=34068 RepID=UPI0024093C82|nr:1-deoxy-D-xylulose-5-phosphate synthase [Cycloclasticus pugetii]MDF1828567.1 1-deoxy-D-xylulose-5-phosphate synthase [Cycloclasticus pugetii]
MTPLAKYPILDKVDIPNDLRNLTEEELIGLSHELREFLISSVSKSGGHLSAGLGTVELTIALHYVFDTPTDKLIWDVGHQAYPHKILTGRKDKISTIRKKHGVTPFVTRAESEYDAFGVGHSSTSISAALGMAIAAAINNNEKRTVAIIGDGGITGGMAFEALNHAGALDANLLVILNDNDMSISPNVGAMKNYLAKILSGKLYTTVKKGSKKVMANMPSVWELARRTEEHVKGMVIPGTLFEEMGFNYIGPIDGHDLPTLVKTLSNLKDLQGPQFLHIVTQKGKGYSPAEADPIGYHGVSTFDPSKEKLPEKVPSSATYSEVFGQWLCDMAKENDKLVGITPAMREGSGMVTFEQQYPEHFFDVGIAEQHAVTLAAGMACEGLQPVVAIYSTFLQRGYDQLIHDVALQKLPVLFAIDRAGLVGPDGPTHAGSYDFSYLRCIPNMVIMAPADENECRLMLTTGIQHKGPVAVRYPRGKGPGVTISNTLDSIPIGKAVTLREGKDIALLAFGSSVTQALEVAEEFNATVINMRFIKPLDEDMIRHIASTHKTLVTLEENVIKGGAGSGVNEFINQASIDTKVLNIGLPDLNLEHGSREELLQEAGLDTQSIKNYIKSSLNKKNT